MIFDEMSLIEMTFDEMSFNKTVFEETRRYQSQ
jgi:hypothetical protein